MGGKGVKGKHYYCWMFSTNFWIQKVCWQCLGMFCLYTSSKISRPWFEFSLKLKVIRSNSDYLLKSSLLYYLSFGTILAFCFVIHLARSVSFYCGCDFFVNVYLTMVVVAIESCLPARATKLSDFIKYHPKIFEFSSWVMHTIDKFSWNKPRTIIEFPNFVLTN